jgi:capsular polysaccharide biosynthesis protein
LLGLLIGYEFYAKFPPAYKATSEVLLTNSPDELSADQVSTNVALAESSAVAGLVVRQLGLDQTVSSFIASYTVTPTTVQVLTFTVGAPSSREALRRASALATAFLQFRTQALEAQQQQQKISLNQQVNQAQRQLDSINAQISHVSAQAGSPAQQGQLSQLQGEKTYAQNQLATTEQNASATLATDQTTTAEMIQQSQVLNAGTALPRSLKKGLALYVAVGLIGGLVIGMGIVMIRALVTDRLRYRVDVADAIGGSVRLSVGPISSVGGLPGPDRLMSRRVLGLRRVVTHLDHVLPVGSPGPTNLAVVAVDNARVVGRAVVALATSHAGRGKKVVVADLSDTIGAGRLLGVKTPGVHRVNAKGVDLIVAVPDRDDMAPIGPVSSTSRTEPPQVDPPLADAYASADLLLTLATLDPASGGDHLATWTTDVVAVVTAGHSSAVRVHAVGEMVRLAGTRLASVVLIGADKRDESLGVPHATDELAPVTPL